MMNDPDPYARAAVRAAVKRSRRYGTEINRTQLRRETCLTWAALNLLISETSQELDSIPFAPPTRPRVREA